eukprot:365811-Chlamydomonas_euryale.AAC.25
MYVHQRRLALYQHQLSRHTCTAHIYTSPACSPDQPCTYAFRPSMSAPDSDPRSHKATHKLHALHTQLTCFTQKLNRLRNAHLYGEIS